MTATLAPHEVIARDSGGSPSAGAPDSPRRRGGRQRRAGRGLADTVHCALAGDERAWDALITEFSGMVQGVARAHRLHDADASDVAQATWLRLLEHVRQLRDPDRVAGWLATTARREALRMLRDDKRRALVSGDMPEHESSERPPDEELLVKERDRALRAAFGRLRASDQALLSLLLAEPRPSYEEIAALLDMATGSIGPTRQRALERLRDELEQVGALCLISNY